MSENKVMSAADQLKQLEEERAKLKKQVALEKKQAKEEKKVFRQKRDAELEQTQSALKAIVNEIFTYNKLGKTARVEYGILEKIRDIVDPEGDLPQDDTVTKADTDDNQEPPG